MLSVEQALSRVLERPLPRRVERLSLGACQGRLLAEPLLAPIPLPRWDNSAMDGYALRAADTAAAAGLASSCEGPGEGGEGVILTVIDEIAAGSAPRHPIGPGEAARIFTGAAMPEGADAVVMQEDTRPAGLNRVAILAPARLGQHVRRQGSELGAQAVALPAGTRLGPAALGVAAALGATHLSVVARPRVVVLATGDELVSPGSPLGPFDIWSSNTQTLLALIEEAGGEGLDAGVARDNLPSMMAGLERAFAHGPDLLLTTGGVSVGDFDVVKQALAGAGMAMDFWKIRMKPGKPLAFGEVGGVPTFGLPGNPVSTLVCFLEFVRPLMRMALGDPRPFLEVVPATFVGNLRRKAGRAELVRVQLTVGPQGYLARDTGPQDSHLLRGAALADALLLLDTEATHIDEGDAVWVQLLPHRGAGAARPDLRWSGRAHR
jgi:molybdopterin molybdotransferase